MKGGVPCLGAMFCRPAKQNIVADDSMIIQKQSREVPETPLKDINFLLGRDPAASLDHGVCPEWEQGESHLFMRNSSGATAIEATSAEVEFRELGDSCFEVHPFDKHDVNLISETALAEAEYEGGDEEYGRIAGNMPQQTRDCDSDHPVSEVASDLTGNHDYLSHAEIVDSDSARYYQNSLTGTYVSNLECQNSFTDLDVASGHVSDPGVYHHTKEPVSTCSSPILPPAVVSEDHGKAEQSLKQVGPGARILSESGRHDNGLTQASDLQVIPLSFKNAAAGVEGSPLPSGTFFPTKGSPRSEGAHQSGESHGMFKLRGSNSETESQKRGPWWKVFLSSHRKIQSELIGGVLGSFSEGDFGRISPVNSYMSDVESRGGRVSPSAFVEGASDSEKEHNYWRVSGEGRSYASTRTSQQKITESLGTSEFLKSVTKGEAISGSLYQGDSSSRTFKPSSASQKSDSFRTGLSRVEEWVSNVQTMAPFIGDDQSQIEVDEIPDSPTAPAASFFGLSRSEVEDRKQGVPTGTRVDGAVDNEAELANIVVRSVNPLSTVAQFSGVGMKVIPSLVMFSSMKILNLSANNLVRITPGCLPKSLHSLDLSRNNIVVIEGLRELSRLRVLNLSFNRISRIGNGLSSCTSLKEMYLAGNKISEVEGLHRLSKLLVLDLSFNKLTTTKSMGQIAANYKSLQSLNLLGNAVHSNLGDEQMRRFVVGICPQLLYLNKHALKTVSSREALGKELKGSSKTSAKPSKRGSSHQLVSSHRRTHSGGIVGNPKNNKIGKGVLSPAQVPQGEGHIRQGNHRNRATAPKDLLPKGFVRLPLAAETTNATPNVGTDREIDQRSGVLSHEQNIWSPSVSQGIVQAH